MWWALIHICPCGDPLQESLKTIVWWGWYWWVLWAMPHVCPCCDLSVVYQNCRQSVYVETNGTVGRLEKKQPYTAASIQGLLQGSPWSVEDVCSTLPLFRAGHLVQQWLGKYVTLHWLAWQNNSMSPGWLAVQASAFKNTFENRCLWRFYKGNYMINKPAAQAADADPSRSSFANRQSPPIQENRCNSWTSDAILMPFEI